MTSCKRGTEGPLTTVWFFSSQKIRDFQQTIFEFTYYLKTNEELSSNSYILIYRHFLVSFGNLKNSNLANLGHYRGPKK